MICPIHPFWKVEGPGGISTQGSDCIEEDCARWNKELGQCDPTGLLPTFVALGNTLGKIADRMPKDLAPGGR